MVEVTQEDRNAAADILDEISSLTQNDGIGQVADLIRDGEYDEHDTVQRTARHRQAGVQQGLDMAAGVAGCERFPAVHVEAAWTDGDDGPQHYNQACDDIAAAIRKLGGDDGTD